LTGDAIDGGAVQLPAGGQLLRDEWFASLATRVVDALPEGVRAAVRAAGESQLAVAAQGGGDLVPAILVAEIARRYAAADHPDDIADWLARSGIALTAPSTLRDVVLPVCELYRSNGLPVPRWWRPDELSRTLLGYYARGRLSATDVRDVMAELVERWELLDPDVGAELLAGAMAPLHEPPDTFTAQSRDPAQRWLQKVAKLAEIRREVDAALAGYSAGLFERTDLTGFVRHIEIHRAIARRLNAASGGRDPVVTAAVRQLERAADQYGKVLAGLTPYERSLLLPAADDDSVLAEVMNLHRRTTRLDIGGRPNTLPDRVGGRWGSTQWLDDYVYNAGGRLLRRSAGPIAHWILVLDGPGLAADVGMLFSEGTAFRLALRESNELATFEVVLPDDPDDPLRASFEYYAREPGSLFDLVVLLLTGQVRLDVFMVAEDGRLCGVGTRLIVLPQEIVDALRGRAAASARLFLADDNEKEIRAKSTGEIQESLCAEFLAADGAKSEYLLAAIDPGGLVTRARPSAASVAAVRAARAALLTVRIEHADRRFECGDDDGGPDPEEDLPDVALFEAQQAYENAVALMQGSAAARRDKIQAASSRVGLRALVKNLVDDTSAIVHLAVVPSFDDFSGQLRAYVATGSGRRLRADRLGESRVPLTSLRDRTPLPLRGPDDFDEMVAAAPDLGRMIAQPLLEQGVRQVTICPVWFLHAVPIHCWPATHGDDLVIDAFDRVCYAPAAAVLRRVRSARPRGTAVVAVSHGSGLRFARAEARLLSALRPAGSPPAQEPVTKEALRAAAPKAAVLHVACHGRWFIDGYWDSGLELAGTGGASRWLSVGEVQRDLDLRGVQVVCLSACESGVSAAGPGSVDRYAGVDGAFLASGARAVVSTLWPVADAAAFLFSAGFYHALAGGATVASAYRNAVSLLRTGEYRVIDGTHPVGKQLATAGVDWPREVRDLENDGIDLTHPFFWGVFKLSGQVDAPVTALAGDSSAGQDSAL
jgi:CHAT domain-containing protein